MTPQSQIAHYRITSKLGEGGMGAVYRASDTKLNRDVAIKVLPESLAADSDRLARFTREAQVLASLNHPNIAAIYGVEDRALVLELVEGDAPCGPMPTEQALPLIHQLIDALEYAHDKGIVHRDLKPANLKITPDGRLKVLDFGLAKAVNSESAVSNPAASPTLTMRATAAGVIMGTAAYMAPEQARGAAVDQRADVWAFGVFVYELLTGRVLFDAPTVSDTLAGVLRQDIDIDDVPARFRRLLRVCLERDVRRRLRHIGDARILLDEAATAPSASTPVVHARSVTAWAAAVAVLAIVLAATGVMWWRATRPVDRPLLRLSVDLGPEAVSGINITAAISPDGTRIVYPFRAADGVVHLGLRYLNQTKTTVLPGTENASDPFFSPDSQSIGFLSNGKLKKTLLVGGAPAILCNSTELRGATWAENGYIYATLTSAASGLHRIPVSGGTPEEVTKPSRAAGDYTHRWPQALPGGEYVLFSASSPASFEEGTLDVLSVKTGKRTQVHRGGYFGRYLPSGHLIFIHDRTLFGVRFDLGTLKLSGAPIPLLEDVSPNDVTGAGQFEFSQNGVLVYLAGMSNQYQLSWLDASGKLEKLMQMPGSYINTKLSPDGERMVLGRIPAAPNDLWTYEWRRDKLLRLTFNGNLNRFPVWMADGKHIIFASQSAGKGVISWMRSDGAGEVQTFLEQPVAVIPTSVSPDGRRLAYVMAAVDTGYDIWTVPFDTSDPEHPKAGKPEPFLKTVANERFPEFSPDGRWLAYDSTESGITEVYVRPFPGPGGKWQVSNGGGQFPMWSRAGHQLFYESSDSHVMMVDYTVNGDSFDPGSPKVWSPAKIVNISPMFPTFELAPDAKRMVVLAGSQNKASVHVSFLLNFFDELKRKLP